MMFLLEMNTNIYIKTGEDLLQKHLALKEKTEYTAFHETQAKKIAYNPQYLYKKAQCAL